MTEGRVVEGPFFDELEVGQIFRSAPAATLTSGLAAVHQSILGDRLALPLDGRLSRVVAQREIAHPALAWNIAIGQSTVVTHHVKANLFYRGLVFHRAPAIGDTLRTVTEVVALRQNSSRPDRAATGLAALRMTTTDHEDRPVLDFFRCAMLPLRDPNGQTDRADDIDSVGASSAPTTFSGAVEGWDLAAFGHRVEGPSFADLAEGDVLLVLGGDVVSSAPELARLTLNIAIAHHDAGTDGRRLVYGGHTIGLALAQATRAIPTMITVTGWHGCDHLGPVYESDTLRSVITIEKTEPMETGGLIHLRSVVTADGETPRQVLDWRFVCVVA